MEIFLADNQGSEMRILIVWLEEFVDNLDGILPGTSPDHPSKGRDVSIIGIHPLKNRLFRILLNSHAQKMQSACASIPLIDGMVIPLHLLPFFLRQAVHNLSRRKRLEDSQRLVILFDEFHCFVSLQFTNGIFPSKDSSDKNH